MFLDYPGFAVCPEFPIWTSGLCIVSFSCPRHNEFATRARPSEVTRFRRIVFARLRSLACLGNVRLHVVGGKLREGVRCGFLKTREPAPKPKFHHVRRAISLLGDPK